MTVLTSDHSKETFMKVRREYGMRGVDPQELSHRFYYSRSPGANCSQHAFDKRCRDMAQDSQCPVNIRKRTLVRLSTLGSPSCKPQHEKG